MLPQSVVSREGVLGLRVHTHMWLGLQHLPWSPAHTCAQLGEPRIPGAPARVAGIWLNLLGCLELGYNQRQWSWGGREQKTALTPRTGTSQAQAVGCVSPKISSKTLESIVQKLLQHCKVNTVLVIKTEIKLKDCHIE